LVQCARISWPYFQPLLPPLVGWANYITHNKHNQSINQSTNQSIIQSIMSLIKD